MASWAKVKQALRDSPLARSFFNELAGRVTPTDISGTQIWAALEVTLRLAQQSLFAEDDCRMTRQSQQILEPVLAHDAAAFWGDPVAVHQVGLQDIGGAPPLFAQHDAWWSTPVGAILTSRTLGAGECIHLLHRDDYESEPTRPLLWDSDSSEATVLEVRSVYDWQALVEWAPRPHFGDMNVPRPHLQYPQYQPDWELVKSRYDAVHVSIWGLLSSAYRVIPFRDGMTYLAGWHPDATAWLNPAPLFRDGPRPLRLAMPQR